MNKQIITTCFLVILASFSFAQDKAATKSNFSLSTKIISQHTWRSIPSGKAPAIEPAISWSKNGFSLNAWAAYAIDNSYKEIDFYATYRWKFIEVGLYDYYCPVPNTKVDFDNLEKGVTEHSVEALATFYLLSSNLRATAGVFLVGADWKKNIKPFTGQIEYEQRYSTYFEVAYDFHFGSVTLSPEVGLTPFEGMYAKEFSIFNYGLSLSKDIKITQNFSLPTSYKMTYNSQLKVFNFAFSFVI